MKAVLNIEINRTIKSDTILLEQISKLINGESNINSVETNPTKQENTLSTQQFLDKIEELKDQIEQLKKENSNYKESIKQYSKSTESDSKRINELEEEYEKSKDKISELEKDKKTYEEMLEDVQKDSTQKLQEKQNEIDRLKNNHQEEIKQKNEEISNLRKRLETYEGPEPTIGKPAFYKVSDDRLVKTSVTSAAYIAKATENGDWIFQFNIESGPVKTACSGENPDLLKFCEVIERQDDASNIRLGKWGTATRNPNGDLIVTNKAEIKLTK